MNVFQLVFKQMRQRALGTWLTMLSVVLGVALAVAVLLVRRGGDSLFGQTDYGYDLIIGKGSPLQLVLNTVYHIDQSPGNVPYSLYEKYAAMTRPGQPLRHVIPIVVGDTYKGRRIVGTTPRMFGADDDGTMESDPTKVFQYRPGKRFELQQGRVFHSRKFEAVIGSDVPALTGLKLGDKFKATHGSPTAGQQQDVHEEQWEVVGVLKTTHTSNDRVLFIPLVTSYVIPDHEEGLAAQAQIRAGGKSTPTHPKPPKARQATAPKAEREDHDHEHGHDRAPASRPAAAAKAGDSHDHDHDHEGEHEDAGAHARPDRDGRDAAAENGHAHEDGHADEGGAHAGHDHPKTYHPNPDGTIDVLVPKDQWLVSAILVKARAQMGAMSLEYAVNADSVATAVSPARVMAEFFNTVLSGSTLVLLLISMLVTVVAGVGILVSIYNSVSARRREIAVLRALGATRARVLTLICLEAGLIGLIGGVIGWLAGHAIGAVASGYMDRLLGQGFPWHAVGWEEGVYLLGVVVLAVLAGLVPALKAYRTPVATNLVAT